MPQEIEPIYAYVQRCLESTKGRWPIVSVGSGVPISTIRKIARGHIPDPGISKVQALADYFSSNTKRSTP